MFVPYVMLFSGLLLIYLEFFLPGGIMGVSGSVLLILGIIFYAMGSSSPIQIIIFASVAILGALLVIIIALRFIKTTSGSSGIYHNKDQEGFHSPSYPSEAIGKEGITRSDLKPAGHILIEGQSHQAISKTGYLKKGKKIVVIEGKGAYLIVKPSKEEKEI